jgi:hypothetical protein
MSNTGNTKQAAGATDKSAAECTMTAQAWLNIERN